MFLLNIFSPEKAIEKDAELLELTLPAEKGELQILPGHASLMTLLKPGRLSYKLKSGKHASFVISWGYCQVSEQGVTVLVEQIFAKEELNAQAIRGELQALEESWSKAEVIDHESLKKLTDNIELNRKYLEFLEQ